MRKAIAISTSAANTFPLNCIFSSVLEMDEFLDKIQASIEAVDTQVEFERISTAFRKRSPLEALPIVEQFIQSFSPSPAQAVEMIKVLVISVKSNPDHSHVHEILEVVLKIMGRVQVSAALTEAILQDLDILLLVKHADTFVRYDALKILKLLVIPSGQALIEVLLSRPDVLAYIIDLSRSDVESEYLRNEAISFLFKLSSDSSNAELLSVLAFQGLADVVFYTFLKSGDLSSSITKDGLSCLLRLAVPVKSGRYIAESEGLDRMTDLITMVIGPVLDHAEGRSSEEDPETLQSRIDLGWSLCHSMLEITEYLVGHHTDKNTVFNKGLVSIALTCGESVFLSEVARWECYCFVSRCVTRETAHNINTDVLWPLFSQLIDERTPLSVRDGIDCVFFSVCASSDELQTTLISMLNGGEESEDPDFYISQSPGRITASVLLHAADTPDNSISDSSALAQQVWYSLMALSHFVRGNIELEKAVLNIRLSETYTVSQLVLKLAKSSCNVISEAALYVLVQLAPSHATIIRTLVDMDLIKVIASRLSSPSACVLLGLLVALADNGSGQAIASSVGLPQLSRAIDEAGIERRRQPTKIKLPTTPWGFQIFVKSVAPMIQRSLLTLFLQAKPVDVSKELSGMVEYQRQRIGHLEEELETARNDTLHETFLIKENRLMRSLIRQLGAELRANEKEIDRLKLLHRTESDTYEKVIDELNQQVEALLVNNKQLNELKAVGVSAPVSPPNDMQDLLELLTEIATRFPETRALIGPLGSVKSEI